MTKQNFFSKGISAPVGILIIVVCALLVGGIFYWQYGEMAKEVQPVVTRPAETERPKEILPPPPPGEESPEEITPSPETANWKTYRNKMYGYSVKYPPQAEIHEASLEDFNGEEIGYKPGHKPEENYKKYTGKICVRIVYNQAELYISAPENRDSLYVYCPFEGLGIGRKPVSQRSIKQSINMDGKIYTAEGLEMIFSSEEEVKTEDVIRFLSFGSQNGTSFRYQPVGNPSGLYKGYLKNEAMIRQILSTFRFIK